ncbi:MAG: methyl-accepting chemotaxis protein [Acidobacteriota bacterium]
MAAQRLRTPRRSRGGPSLRTRQALGVAALLGALAALMTLVYSSALADRSFEMMRRRAVTAARLLATAGEEAIGDGRSERLQRMFERLAGERDLVHLELVDAKGRVLAHGGTASRPPQYSLFDEDVGASRVPARRADRMPGLMGEPLYIFTVPVLRREQSAAPRPRPSAGGSVPGPGSAVAAERGATIRRPPLGEVRLAFRSVDLETARRELAWKGTGLGLLAMLAGVLFTQALARRQVTDPARRLAGLAARIADGDLTPRIEEDLSDEMGEVAEAFNRMIDRLEAMVSGLRRNAARLDEALEEIKAIADVVVAGTRNQQEAVKRISVCADAVADSIRKVAGSVGSLSVSSEGTSTSILEMIASIEEVAGHADGLTMSVNDTSATTEEVVSAIREIDRSVDMLNQFVEETSNAMGQMNQAIRQVEHNAAEGKAISELVARRAEVGMRAVELTIEGMEGISGSVLESSRVIESVGRRGREIGLILSVIQEVTEQTNLLALNASIIAAQAGEHGRGFAVVADEIRQLAERTASSAKEIGSLIASFQSETERAVAAMQEGSRRVAEGSERSREAGRALEEILESARRSSTMVSEIAGATREQARGSEAISGSVDRVRDMVAHIKQSTAEQTLGSEQIMSAVENMREMAGHVKRATVAQTKGSRLITQAIENVAEMVSSIQRAADEQRAASEQILKVLDGFASVTSANLASATRMREAMEALRLRSGALHDEIVRFRIRG